MKNLIGLLIVCLSFSTMVAQESVENTYKVKGDLLETTLYYDNGNVAQMGFYTKDRNPHGEWVSFNRNGKKTAIAQYDNGKKVGTWVFFQGDTRKEVRYLDSKILEVKTLEVIDSRVVTYK